MEGNGELNRVLYVLKSRGMAHSNQIREFLLTDHGIELADVYVGPQGVLTGSARQAQEAQELTDGDGADARISSSGGQPRTPARGGRGADRGAVARVRGRGGHVDRLLSHGSTGAEDRADQRAEQGRLRSADAMSRRRPHARRAVTA